MPVLRYAVQMSNHEGSPPSTNVFHIRTTDPNDNPFGAQQRKDAVASLQSMYAGLAPNLSGGMILTFPDLAIDVETNQFVDVETPGNLTVAGTARQPSVLSVCVNWATSDRSRRGRGRTFFGPLGASSVDADGNPAVVMLDRFVTVCEAFISRSLTDNGWAFGVYGQQAPGVAGAKVLRDLTGMSVNRKQFSVMTSRRG